MLNQNITSLQQCVGFQHRNTGLFPGLGKTVESGLLGCDPPVLFIPPRRVIQPWICGRKDVYPLGLKPCERLGYMIRSFDSVSVGAGPVAHLHGEKLPGGCGDRRQQKDEFPPQGSIEHLKKKKKKQDVLWQLAGTSPENPVRGQGLHQSWIMLSCLLL